jgi:hypothetical protein
MAGELSAAHRRQVLARLAELGDELGNISTWLTGCDEDRAAILIESAWESVAAGAWALERTARRKPEGWLADPQQNGRHLA